MSIKDISIHIFNCLPINDCHSLGLVNREFQKGYLNELHWKNLLDRDYADDYDLMKTTNYEVYKYSHKMRKIIIAFRGNAKNKDVIKERTLEFYSKKMESLLSEIGVLINLQTIDVNSNLLKSLPSEIGLLVNLRQLYLNHNQLQYLPSEIGLLVNLRILYLNNNQLQYLPLEIGLLVNLRNLTLYTNKLKTLPEEIKLLTNLQKIGIDDILSNQVKQLLPNARITYTY